MAGILAGLVVLAVGEHTAIAGAGATIMSGGVGALSGSIAITAGGVAISVAGCTIVAVASEDAQISFAKAMNSSQRYFDEKKAEGDGDAEEGDDYYKKGRPEGGNPTEDTLLRKDTADVKSEDFKEFLEGKGETPSKWKKVMETWETPDGDVYERHYWTNGTDSYYHN